MSNELLFTALQLDLLQKTRKISSPDNINENITIKNHVKIDIQETLVTRMLKYIS